MPHRYIPVEIMALADRMIGRGISKMNDDQPSMQKDMLAAGRLLAHLILNGTIAGPIEFE